MKRRRTPAGRMAEKLYVLPFLLVCALFVWFGMEELLPGRFGEVWTLLASGITLYGWIALLRKPALAWKAPALHVGGKDEEGSASAFSDTAPDSGYDPLMAEVDRILGLEGVLEAKLESDAEQRERLEEVRALYELHSISEEDYQRKFREILEEKK